MKETNSMIMTARGKKYIENDLREEGDSLHDSSLGDSFQFHMGRKNEEKKGVIRKKKSTVKSGGFEMRRKPGESTVILETSPGNDSTLMSGSKLFHQKKLSVGNMSVLESLKNLSTSFELGLTS